MKKIFQWFLVIFVLTITVHAEVAVNEPDKNLTNGIITISGSNTDVDLKDSLNIIIVNPGYTLNDVKTGIKAALQQYATVDYNSDGSFTFSFKNHPPQNAGDRWYKCYITGDGISSPIPLDYYFASATDMKTQIENINICANNMVGDENGKPTQAEIDAFKSLIVQSEDMFSLKNDFYNAVDLSKMCSNLMVYVKNNNFAVDAYSEVAKTVKLFSLLECYSEGKTELCFEDGGIKDKDLLGISTLDSDKSCTIVSLYENSVNEEGKGIINSALLNQTYTDKEAFLKFFSEQVMVNAVKYPKTGGSGHITNVLTSGNTSFVGIDVSNYISSNNKDYYNSQIIFSIFTTAKELEAEVNKLVNNPPVIPGNNGNNGDNGNNSSGSFGGSSSSSNKHTYTGENKGNDIDYINEIDKTKKIMKFSDIDENHWAYENVKSLFEKDIISGTSETTFSPDSYVTREQITKMIVNAFSIETNTDSTNFGFSDVDKNEWYYSYVLTAKNKGIINGKNEEFFGIGEYVTRQDIATMIYRAVGEKLTLSSKELNFSDNESISEYALKAVENLYKAEIINGMTDGSFQPNGNCTRAEAATLINKAIVNIGGVE